MQWAHDAGFASSPDVRWSPPVPPRPLRAITSFEVEERFLAHGMADAACVLQVCTGVAAQPFRPGTRFLDFGCGCGRLLRYLGMVDWINTSGCDVHRELVDWCHEHLPMVQTKLNGVEPPLPFDDRSFDVVAAVSVFTHLSRENGVRWIRDLARVLAPGGILLITTHGYSSVLIATTSPPHQELLGLDHADAGRLIEQLSVSHFVFRPYPANVVEVARAGPAYGMAFVERQHVLSSWTSPGLRLVELIPGGLRGFQDIVVLERT